VRAQPRFSAVAAAGSLATPANATSESTAQSKGLSEARQSHEAGHAPLPTETLGRTTDHNSGKDGDAPLPDTRLALRYHSFMSGAVLQVTRFGNSIVTWCRPCASAFTSIPRRDSRTFMGTESRKGRSKRFFVGQARIALGATALAWASVRPVQGGGCASFTSSIRSLPACSSSPPMSSEVNL
jgi:hypothetical protein